MKQKRNAGKAEIESQTKPWLFISPQKSSISQIDETNSTVKDETPLRCRHFCQPTFVPGLQLSPKLSKSNGRCLNLRRNRKKAPDDIRDCYFQFQQDDINFSKKTQKVSDYKNLGKALVKLFRRVIQLEKLSLQGQSGKVVEDLWSIFMKSTPNITMASAVLGDINNFNYITLVKLGFKRVIQKVSKKQIQAAQNLLRLSILSQLQSIDLDAEIDKSKVVQKEKFKVYMKVRIHEMRQGLFKQRINFEGFEDYFPAPLVKEENVVKVEEIQISDKQKQGFFGNDLQNKKKDDFFDQMIDGQEIVGEKENREQVQNFFNHEQNQVEDFMNYSIDLLKCKLEQPWII